jgi:NADH-dependent peroxiredoxin subunit F
MDEPFQEDVMKIDPVCRMECREEEALTAESNGRVYYFCSEGCRKKFLQELEIRTVRTTYDLVIIGGGPAGLTAAIYASTLKMNALLITRDLGGQAIDSTKVENYMGYDFITGPELIEKFRGQLLRSRYIDHLINEVEKIEPLEEGYEVTTSELNRYRTSALLIATGMTRRRLNLPGEEKFQRRGVFYGNIQDFSFVEGEDVVVIGGGNSALQIAEDLGDVSGRISLVSDFPLSADPVIIERVRMNTRIKIYEEYKPVEFRGEGNLKEVAIRKRAEEEVVSLPARGVFIAIGFQPNSALVSGMVDLNTQGEIRISPNCSTSRAGIFAAGDVTNAFGKRIIIACGEGAKAVMAARQYLFMSEKMNREALK